MASPQPNGTGHPSVVKNEVDATSGSKEGVVRYVLGISLGLAVIAMILAFVVF